MNINFRFAKTDDLSAIVDVYKSGIQGMLDAGIKQWDKTYPNAQTIEEDVRNGDLHLCICDGKIAAAFALNRKVEPDYETTKWQKPEANWIAMHRLCVNPDFQRMGIGRACMQEIERFAQENGCNAIHLDTFSENMKALSLYRSLGFIEVGEAFWRKGRFIIFEKNL